MTIKEVIEVESYTSMDLAELEKAKRMGEYILTEG